MVVRIPRPTGYSIAMASNRQFNKLWRRNGGVKARSEFQLWRSGILHLIGHVLPLFVAVHFAAVILIHFGASVS